MSVTLSQIARAVGVSQPVVSCALNGKPGVSAAKRAEIMRVAEQMGYRSSDSSPARTMAARRHGRRVAHGVIALMYSVVKDDPWLNDPYHREFVNGSIYEAGQRRMAIYVLPMCDVELPSVIRGGGVDGVILQTFPARSEELERLKIPSVLFCGRGPNVYILEPEEENGMYLAVRHLIELGHRHIAFAGAFTTFTSGRRRFAGYRRAMAEAGLEMPEEWVVDMEESDEPSGYEAMSRLLQLRPRRGSKTAFTALVCFNDLLAMGAIRRCREAGVRVPEDMSVTGFDDLSLERHFLPPLTSVAYSRFGMGQRAVSWICDETMRLIALGADEDPSGSTPRTGIERFPIELMVRSTTCPPDRK